MNIKKFLVGSVAGALMLGALAVPALATGGFDANGYNYTARIFNGTVSGDNLVMKWNAAWDTCNAGGDCTGAWINNEWNGNVPGGSGIVSQYKIVWIPESCTDYSILPDGGMCIWGHYEMLLFQGTWPDYGHYVGARAVPNGYGTVK